MAQTNPPNVWAFITELINRFGRKNPVIFNIIAWIGAIATFLTGLPALIESLGINLPEWATALQNKVVAGAGIAMMIIANLPVQSTTKAVEDGALPFTEKKIEEKNEANLKP